VEHGSVRTLGAAFDSPAVAGEIHPLLTFRAERAMGTMTAIPAPLVRRLDCLAPPLFTPLFQSCISAPSR